MAVNNRLLKDKNNGKVFIPMNMQGGTWNENFMSTTKMVAIAGLLGYAFIQGLYLRSVYADFADWVVFYIIYFIIAQFVVRYVIFEEKFYYRMYKNLKKNEITTPAMFWSIASQIETDDGDIFTYSDGKIGVIIRLDRDTVTGRKREFREEHYDAVSEFYKKLHMMNYSYVIMDVMERAGKDARLEELDKLVTKADNKNIKRLLELKVSHLKSICQSTLIESDYIVLYTNNISKMDSILNDASDIVSVLLEGAFINYKILKIEDAVELVKDETGVKYFDYTNATLEMFNSSESAKGVIDIKGIVFRDGYEISTRVKENRILKDLAYKYKKGTLNLMEVDVRDKLVKSLAIEELGYELESLKDTLNVVKGREKKGKKEKGDRVKKVDNILNNLSKRDKEGDRGEEVFDFDEFFEGGNFDVPEHDSNHYSSKKRELKRDDLSSSINWQDMEDEYIDV